MTVDSVNNLKFLTIQGNTRLESVSFEGLSTVAKDAVVYVGAYDSEDGIIDTGNKNRLIASKIHLEVKSGAGKQTGKIEDASGLSDLKGFLGSSNIKTAVVHYDGTTELKESKTAEAEDDVDIDADNGEHFLLFRKNVPKGAVTEKQAKRVFVATISRTAPGSITIRAAGAYKTIALSVGGTPANWVAQVNASEVKSFFDANGVIVEASAGGWKPQGLITFGPANSSDATEITDTEIRALGDGAYIKLGIGGQKLNPCIRTQCILLYQNQEIKMIYLVKSLSQKLISTLFHMYY